jgi:hypothetical protein
MIAMMEAAGSQMALERRGQDEVDENAEAERILSGIEAMSGACGTFAVKEEHGLAVLPYDPRKRVCGSDSTSHGDGEPFHVVKGQTLQIVQVQDGVYKIARDGGYVVASESQLVKGKRQGSGPRNLLYLKRSMIYFAFLQLEDQWKLRAGWKE